MFEKLAAAVKANKKTIIRNSLIVGGTALGLALTIGFAKALSEGEEVLVVETAA